MKLELDSLGLEEAALLKAELLREFGTTASTVAVDLSMVNKVDISAIQLFLSLQKSLEADNRRLRLLNCTNGVTEALELCGCAALLECGDE